MFRESISSILLEFQNKIYQYRKYTSSKLLNLKRNTSIWKIHFLYTSEFFLLNWSSLHARPNRHYKAWSYKKKKNKKVKPYRKSN